MSHAYMGNSQVLQEIIFLSSELLKPPGSSTLNATSLLEDTMEDTSPLVDLDKIPGTAQWLEEFLCPSHPCNLEKPGKLLD